jgi:2-phospho-L-lactate guanylyltransferase
MLEDVLAAVARTRGVAGIAVVTVDARAVLLAQSYGARILTEDARGGHTAAVAGAARLLAAEGVGGMLQLPGDIPLATPEEVSLVLSMHRAAPSFTIVPSHDDLGSNAVVVSPPTAVPLAFGDDSFIPHLRTARHCGIEPLIARTPGIGRDIDNMEDLAIFARVSSNTRTQAFLDQHDFADWGRSAGASHQMDDVR